MSKDIVRQLKQLKHDTVNPRSEWVATNRALLLSQIKNTLPVEPVISTEKKLEKIWAAMAIFLPRPLVYNVVRPIGVLLLVSFVATSAYSSTVKASYETLPGDWLYPAKRTAERAQGAVISLLGDQNTETKFHVSLAQRRASEVKQIIAINDPAKVANVGTTVAELKNELNSINTKLEPGLNTMHADTAKEVKQNTEAIKDTLQDVKNTLLLSSSSTNKTLLQVGETKDLAKDISVNAMEAMVVKHLEGDNTVSRQDVKNALDTSIANVAVDVLASKQTVDGAKTIVDSVKTQVTDLTGEITKQKTESSLATTTQAYNQKLTDAASQTKEASIQTDQVTAAVDKKIDEVRQAVSDDNLTKAIDNLKEASEATKQAEKISDTTIYTTQAVLPIVQVIKDATALATIITSSTLNVSTTKDIFSLASTSLMSPLLNAPISTSTKMVSESVSSTVKR